MNDPLDELKTFLENCTPAERQAIPLVAANCLLFQIGLAVDEIRFTGLSVRRLAGICALSVAYLALECTALLSQKPKPFLNPPTLERIAPCPNEN